MIAILLSLLATLSGHIMHVDSVRGLTVSPQNLRAFPASHAREVQSEQIVRPQFLRAFAA